MKNMWIIIAGLMCFAAAQAPAQTFEQQVAQISQQVSGTALKARQDLAAPGVQKTSSGNGSAADRAAIEWVSIPAGTFKMGSQKGDSVEKPVHEVTIKGFEMSKTEVTVEQYKACVYGGECTKPAEGGHCNWGNPGREKHPINCVSWYQAVTFAEWAGGRLPSEAEWEYAARSAGKDYTYPWGNEEPTCGKAVMDFNNLGCGRNSTWPVCSKTSGNTEQGLCDMTGNVWEWVQDVWHSSYAWAPQDGSAWTEPTGSSHVNRGGSWLYAAWSLRSAYRRYDGHGSRYVDLGFRLVRSSR